ncbi:MAG TPA: glycoside hydrolase family 1 protein, partial [Telluria sp.]
GLYDLDRNIRPVGEAYRELIRDWGAVLPTQSVCLRVPIALPQEGAACEVDDVPAATEPHSSSAATGAPTTTETSE